MIFCASQIDRCRSICCRKLIQASKRRIHNSHSRCQIARRAVIRPRPTHTLCNSRCYHIPFLCTYMPQTRDVTFAVSFHHHSPCAVCGWYVGRAYIRAHTQWLKSLAQPLWIVSLSETESVFKKTQHRTDWPILVAKGKKYKKNLFISHN